MSSWFQDQPHLLPERYGGPPDLSPEEYVAHLRPLSAPPPAEAPEPLTRRSGTRARSRRGCGEAAGGKAVRANAGALARSGDCK